MRPPETPTCPPTMADDIAAMLRKRLADAKTPEQRKQEIAWAQEAVDKLNADDPERRASMAEQVAATAQNFLQGVSFGFSDEILGALPGVAKEEQSLYRQQLKDHPALGYTAQLAGGLVTPPFLKVAKGASTLRKVGTVLGEGAMQGGLAAAGTNEGGLLDRAKAAARGAGTGAAITGTLAGLGKGAVGLAKAGGRKLGITVPSLAETIGASPTLADDLTQARRKLSRLQGLGLADETMVADVLPQGEGALRAAATANKSVRNDVDRLLGQRSNRLANTADDVFSSVTGAGREGADKSIADFVAQRKAEAQPLYDRALDEGRAFDELANTMGKTPSKAFAKKAKIALNDPDVQRAIAAVKSGPTDRTVARGKPIRHEVMDAAYKYLNGEYGAAKRALDAGTGGADAYRAVQGLNVARQKLRAAIIERAPTYADALETFSDESSLLDAFQRGTQATRRDPSLVARDVTQAAQEGTGDALRKGHAAAFRDMTVPNVDLGEFAKMHDPTNPIKTRDAAARFKAAFGEDAYNTYRDKLLGIVELQRLKAGKGESTTLDKLMEQADADPVALARAIAFAAAGSPGAAVANTASGLGRTLRDLGARSAQAKENVTKLTQRGASDVGDFLTALEQEISQRKVPQRPTGIWGRPLQSLTRVTSGSK